MTLAAASIWVDADSGRPPQHPPRGPGRGRQQLEDQNSLIVLLDIPGWMSFLADYQRPVFPAPPALLRELRDQQDRVRPEFEDLEAMVPQWGEQAVHRPAPLPPRRLDVHFAEAVVAWPVHFPVTDAPAWQAHEPRAARPAPPRVGPVEVLDGEPILTEALAWLVETPRAGAAPLSRRQPEEEGGYRLDAIAVEVLTSAMIVPTTARGDRARPAPALAAADPVGERTGAGGTTLWSETTLFPGAYLPTENIRPLPPPPAGFERDRDPIWVLAELYPWAGAAHEADRPTPPRSDRGRPGDREDARSNESELLVQAQTLPHTEADRAPPAPPDRHAVEEPAGELTAPWSVSDALHLGAALYTQDCRPALLLAPSRETQAEETADQVPMDIGLAWADTTDAAHPAPLPAPAVAQESSRVEAGQVEPFSPANLAEQAEQPGRPRPTRHAEDAHEGEMTALWPAADALHLGAALHVLDVRAGLPGWTRPQAQCEQTADQLPMDIGLHWSDATDTAHPARRPAAPTAQESSRVEAAQVEPFSPATLAEEVLRPAPLPPRRHAADGSEGEGTPTGPSSDALHLAAALHTQETRPGLPPPLALPETGREADPQVPLDAGVLALPDVTDARPLVPPAYAPAPDDVPLWLSAAGIVRVSGPFYTVAGDLHAGGAEAGDVLP